MTGICRDTLKHDSPYNLHIFLNSVEGTKAILDTLEATPEIARIVCADNSENRRKLAGFPISRTADPARRINIYTSTAFEGCDIYDRDGMTFIVSDTMKRHSMIDISTSMIQICGRVRDSRYREIIHLYDTLPYRDTTFGQFEKATWKKVEEAEEYVQWLNSAPERIRANAQKIISYSDDRYIINTGGTYKVDRNMAKHEIVNWKTVNGIYTAGNTVEDAIRNQGMEITNSDNYSEPKTEAVFSQRAKFKDLFERYCKIRDNEPQICFRPSAERILIETKNPLVREAYEKIGADEVRKMKYHQSNIRRRLIAESQKNFAVKVVEMLDIALKKQTWIPSAKVKSELQKIYDSLGIKRTAKATDIDEWYEVKRGSRYIDGRNTHCVMILRKTFISLKNF